MSASACNSVSRSVSIFALKATRKQVLIAFQSIPVDTLKAAIAEAENQVSRNGCTTDLTGSGNIHFTHIPAGYFAVDPQRVT
jgi:hypothetical protein